MLAFQGDGIPDASKMQLCRGTVHPILWRRSSVGRIGPRA